VPDWFSGFGSAEGIANDGGDGKHSHQGVPSKMESVFWKRPGKGRQKGRSLATALI
jgi:hypothetical protein